MDEGLASVGLGCASVVYPLNQRIESCSGFACFGRAGCYRLLLFSVCALGQRLRLAREKSNPINPRPRELSTFSKNKQVRGLKNLAKKFEKKKLFPKTQKIMQSPTDPTYETPQVDEEELALMDRAFFDNIATAQAASASWSGMFIVVIFCVILFLVAIIFVLRRVMKKRINERTKT
jgi:hypothetical protein